MPGSGPTPPSRTTSRTRSLPRCRYSRVATPNTGTARPGTSSMASTRAHSKRGWRRSTRSAVSDLTALLTAELDRQQRPHDGLLHASEHFVGSLRHVQLAVAGAPKRPEAFVRRMPLYIGSAIHDLAHAALKGQPYMAEVDVTPWMPDGWGGTADALRFNPETKTFRLQDYKSIMQRGIYYVLEDGAKEEHQAQASLYYYAAQDMGLDMEPEID